MFCEVTPLRQAGLRLRPSEWPAPVKGQLAVSHMPASICASRRTLREVKVLGRWVSERFTQLLMFDPEFVDVVGDGFLLRGYEIHTQQERQFEHQQLWLVRPCQGEDAPPLPPFDAQRWANQLPPAETRRPLSISEQWHMEHVQK